MTSKSQQNKADNGTVAQKVPMNKNFVDDVTVNAADGVLSSK